MPHPREPRTVYLLIPELRARGGFEGQVVALSCGLKAHGVDVFVFSRQPIDPSHPGLTQMRRAGVRVLFPPLWLYRLADLNLGRRARLTRALTWLWAPVLAPLAMVDRIVRHRPLARSWQGAWGRMHGLIGAITLRDWATELFFRLLDDVARRHPPDIVDVQHSCLPQGLIWGHRRGFPLVYTEYGAPDERLSGVWAPLKGVVNYAHFIIGRSQASLDGLRRLCEADRPGAVLPNAVTAVPSINDPAALEPPDNGEITITAVSRLAPEKGLPYLLEAFRALREEGLPVRLILAGDGPLRSTLQAQVAAWRLNGAVRFTGAFDHLAPIMRATHIVAHPTLNDGRSVTVLEAMAWGRPVVASRIGGVPELIEDQVSGLLVPPADPRALAEALRCLILDPDRRRWMGQTARARFLQGGFSPEGVARSTLAIYRRLLAGEGVTACASTW